MEERFEKCLKMSYDIYNFELVFAVPKKGSNIDIINLIFMSLFFCKCTKFNLITQTRVFNLVA